MEINSAYQFMKQLKPGCVLPIYKKLEFKGNVNNYFKYLTENGKRKHSFLLESADIIPRYGESSIGCNNPALYITGKDDDFSIIALNSLGIRLIKHIAEKLDYCQELEVSKDKIKGKLKPVKKNNDEYERLKSINHTQILRDICFCFKPTMKPFSAYGGLFGAFAYDFIDQFEELPKNKEDLYNDPDYYFVLADNLFYINHQTDELFIVANAYIDETESIKVTYEECLKKIENLENAYNESLKIDIHPTNERNNTDNNNIETDCNKTDYMEIVKACQEKIKEGYVFQIVPSRTTYKKVDQDPFTIYQKLKEVNPSPYMFYFSIDDGYIIGASPEMAIKVSEDPKSDLKLVETRPIAGTKPRGFINGKYSKELDSRYETELRTDFKELAEHSMLIDLSRNDIAKISIAGSRHVSEPFIVEKYSHVQHLVSTVSGYLNPDLDAFHAYIASMNQGTLTGAPKVSAMSILRDFEKHRRGFYGGAVCYFTHHGELDSTIIIRTIRLKDNIAYVRAGAGIVLDSNPESEFLETKKKSAACLNVL